MAWLPASPGGRIVRKWASQSSGDPSARSGSRPTMRSAHQRRGRPCPRSGGGRPCPRRRGGGGRSARGRRRSRRDPGTGAGRAGAGARGPARVRGSGHASTGHWCGRSTGGRTAPCRGPSRGGCAQGPPSEGRREPGVGLTWSPAHCRWTATTALHCVRSIPEWGVGHRHTTCLRGPATSGPGCAGVAAGSRGIHGDEPGPTRARGGLRNRGPPLTSTSVQRAWRDSNPQPSDP